MIKHTLLLTGGSGFIGQNILEQLHSKYEILSPSHKELDFINASDVLAFLSSKKVDFVVHAINSGGARNQVADANMVEKNLRCFFNIAHLNKMYKKMIFIGSGAEYNKKQNLTNVSEDFFGQSIPEDQYGFYKYICSEYIQGSDKIINLRCFGVYGQYEDYTVRFISNAIVRSIFGLPISINKNCFFDYLEVGDLVNVIDFSLTNQLKHKFYNVGSGQKIDLLSIAKIIKEITGNPHEIIVKQDGLGNEYTCNVERLKQEMPNFVPTSLQDGITNLYKWYASIKSTINSDTLTFDS